MEMTGSVGCRLFGGKTFIAMPSCDLVHTLDDSGLHSFATGNGALKHTEDRHSLERYFCLQNMRWNASPAEVNGCYLSYQQSEISAFYSVTYMKVNSYIKQQAKTKHHWSSVSMLPARCGCQGPLCRASDETEMHERSKGHSPVFVF